MGTENSRVKMYLFFNVGGSRYAIEAFKTLGVCEITSLTPLAQPRPYEIGLTHLGGDIWSVIDLQILMYGKETAVNKSGKLLAAAIDDGEHKFLAVIEAPVSVSNISANMILPAGSSSQTSSIREFINTGGVTAGILPVEKMFGT